MLTIDFDELSPKEQLALLPLDEQQRILAAYDDDQASALLRDWHFHARPKQLAPMVAWFIWFIMTGRGWGKTRTGAEFLLDQIVGWKHDQTCQIALVGRTEDDARRIMVEGVSGLLECAAARGIKAVYEKSNKQVIFPDHNAIATVFTAEVPAKLRGPEHHFAWCDEFAAWKFIIDSQGGSAWSNLLLGMRLPECDPKIVVTTTPKPVPMVRELWDQAHEPGNSVVLTTGAMNENKANLARAFIREVTSMYGGTSIASQEILGLLLAEAEGALWKMSDIDEPRILDPSQVPSLKEVDVGVDPSFSSGKSADECGIIVGGIEGRSVDPLRKHAYILEDLSGRMAVAQWSRRVVEAYWRYGCNYVIVESNLGGKENTENIIHQVDPAVQVKTVRAMSDKAARSGTAVGAYQQHRVHHVGHFGELESQQVTWVPHQPGQVRTRDATGAKSPDRVDACVHLLNHLLPITAQRPGSTSGKRLSQTRLPSTKIVQ